MDSGRVIHTNVAAILWKLLRISTIISVPHFTVSLKGRGEKKKKGNRKNSHTWWFVLGYYSDESCMKTHTFLPGTLTCRYLSQKKTRKEDKFNYIILNSCVNKNLFGLNCYLNFNLDLIVVNTDVKLFLQMDFKHRRCGQSMGHDAGRLKFKHEGQSWLTFPGGTVSLIFSLFSCISFKKVKGRR